MKKSNVLIVVIIFMSIAILALAGYILYSHKLIEDKNVERKKNNNKKVEDKVEISEEEIALMKMVSEKTFSIDKEKFVKDDFQGEDYIYTLVSISGKNYSDVTGSELKEISNKYFGIDNFEFVPIKCFMALKDDIHVGDAQYMLKYNSSTDKYEWNENHPGHGGSGTGYGHYLAEKDYSYKDGKYYYNMDVFFYNDGCYGDTCGPSSYYDVYLTYKDLVNETNKLINAISNNKYCVTVEEGLYNCNRDSIYLGIKNKLHTVTFEFVKNNNNLVFNGYEFK